MNTWTEILLTPSLKALQPRESQPSSLPGAVACSLPPPASLSLQCSFPITARLIWDPWSGTVTPYPPVYFRCVVIIRYLWLGCCSGRYHVKEQLPVGGEGRTGERRDVLPRARAAGWWLEGRSAHPLTPRAVSCSRESGCPPCIPPAQRQLASSSSHPGFPTSAGSKQTSSPLCFSGRLAEQRQTPSLSFFCGSSSGSSSILHICPFPALVFAHWRCR